MIGNIYKIEFNEYTYIGSTTQNIKQRQWEHNSHLKNKNCLLYKKARDCNISKIECILIEEVEVDSRLDLRKIEQDYLNKYEPNLNSLNSYRTDDENKLNKKKTNKIYRDKNKEIINENSKIYRDKNKEAIKEYKKIYSDKNRVVINQKSKEKIQCSICNKLISIPNITRHIKTIH